MIYRAIISGVASASLLFIIGCAGGDPEPQPSGESSAPHPAAGSPVAGLPTDPIPSPESPDESEADTLESAASESTTPEPKPVTYLASDFGGPSETPASEPVPAKTASASASLTPDLSKLTSFFPGGKQPKNLEEVLNGKSRKRPDDITKWELTDVMPAMKENDHRLKMAMMYMVKKHAGNPLIAMLLTKILEPQVPKPASNLQGGGGGMPGEHGMMQPSMQSGGYGGRGGGYGGRGGQAFKIDQQTVEMIILSLTINNTPQAANTLRGIIKEKKFKTVHPQAATKAAIKGLAVMDADRDKNNMVLFTALTDPKKYRDPSANVTAGGGYPGAPGRGYGGGAQGQKEQRLSAEQLSQEAEKTLKPIASEGLRMLLADYLIKNTTSLTETDRFGPWFSESLPMNIPGQLMIYEKKANENIPPLLEGFLSKLEQNFTTYSGAAIARLLGVMATTPDLSLLGKSGQTGGRKQPSAGWGTGGGMGGGMDMGMLGRGGGYGAGADVISQYLSKNKKTQNISPEEELARLTKAIWSPKVAAAVAARLNKQHGLHRAAGAYGGPMGGGAASANQEVTLACTMPLDEVRRAILKRCKNRYQHGPTAALGNFLGQNGSPSAGMDPAISLASGAMRGMGMSGRGGGANSNLLAVDPGMLVVMKMLPRENPNAQANGKRTGRKGGGPPPHGPGPGSGPNGNMQHQWFNMSQKLVTKLLAQCLIAASSNTGGMDTAVTSSGTEEGEPPTDPCPVALHRGAEIATRLDFKLPGYVKGPLGSLPVDPLEVHYVRIEETSNVQKVMGHYKRAVKGQNHVLSNNMGYWFDGIGEGTTPGSMRSVDVIISPGVEKPVDPFSNDRNARKKKGVPIVVQILTIETANPAEAK